MVKHTPGLGPISRILPSRDRHIVMSASFNKSIKDDAFDVNVTSRTSFIAVIFHQGIIVLGIHFNVGYHMLTLKGIVNDDILFFALQSGLGS